MFILIILKIIENKTRSQCNKIDNKTYFIINFLNLSFFKERRKETFDGINFTREENIINLFEYKHLSSFH